MLCEKCGREITRKGLKWVCWACEMQEQDCNCPPTPEFKDYLIKRLRR